MRLKRLATASLLFAALGAILASSAFAAATTTDVKWYIGSGSGKELSGTATAKAEQLSPESTFTTTVSGTAVELHSTKVECEACTIENSGGTAVGTGKLKFTGVTVAKPSGCSVASTLTTKSLKVKADYMISTTNYILFEPSAGAETALFTAELTGEKCALKTAITPKGTVFLQAANATGTQAVAQEVCTTGPINTEAGGSLHVGTEAATLGLGVKFTLSTGEQFGTH